MQGEKEEKKIGLCSMKATKDRTLSDFGSDPGNCIPLPQESVDHVVYPMSAFIFAAALSSLLVIHARRKKSLSTDGQAAAFLLGMATFSSRFAYFTAILIAFFLASSKLTKV